MGWTQEEQSQYIQTLNDQLAELGDRGNRVIVVDTTEYAQNGANNKMPLIQQVYEEVTNRGDFFGAEENIENGLSSRAVALGRYGDIGITQSSHPDPSNPNYVSVAFSAPADEAVNESMHYFSRATAQGADFSTSLTQEFTSKFTIDHEMGHSLQGNPPISDDNTHSKNFHERSGDAFASLKAIQDGMAEGDLDSTLEQLEVMADARDLRIGYAPDRSALTHGLSHDTSSTINEIVDRARAGTLPENFEEMDLVELNDLAQDIAADTTPDYDLFQKMEVAHDIIRSEVGVAQVDPAMRAEHIAALPSVEGLDEVIVDMSKRFDTAHQKTPGLESSYDVFPDVQAAQKELEDIGLKAAKENAPHVQNEFDQARGMPAIEELDISSQPEMAQENNSPTGDFTGADAAYVGNPELLKAANEAGINYNPDLNPQPEEPIPGTEPAPSSIKTAPSMMQP